MTTTTFVDNSTVVPAAWLNDVDTAAYKTLSSVSGTNTITATGPANAALAAGLAFEFIAAGANTGAVTLNVTPSGGAALGAKSITKFGTTALVAGDIVSGSAYRVVYDGTRFVLLNPGAIPVANVSMATSRILGRTTASTGAVEELTVGSSLSLSAGSLNASTASSSDVQTGTEANKVMTPSAYRGGALVLGTAQATTSGTTITLSSTIPSWAKRITVMFSGVSISGTDSILVQIGSGSFTTSGYSGCAGDIQNAASSFTTSSGAGFIVVANAGTTVLHGSITLSLMDSSTNTWICTHIMGWSNVAVPGFGGGSVALAGTLDRIRITTSGVNTFDAGSVNYIYE